MPITYMLHPPNPNGFHADEAVIFCGRKARLDNELRTNANAVSLNGNFGIGLIFHAYMDLYATQKISAATDLEKVTFAAPDKLVVVDSEAEYEAKRLAKEHFTKFPFDHNGTLLGAEFELPQKNRAAVENAVGRSPYSGRVDLIAKPTKVHAKKLLQDLHVEIEPGKPLLVDWKTEGREEANLVDRSRYNLQATAYMLAWNAENPKQQCSGMLIRIVIKTKEPKFRAVFIPPPGPAEIAALHSRFRFANLLRTMAPDQPNASRSTCFGWGGTCAHFLDSRCNRS